MQVTNNDVTANLKEQQNFLQKLSRLASAARSTPDREKIEQQSKTVSSGIAYGAHMQSPQSIELWKDKVSLGRDAGNDVVIRDMKVSREHAVICRDSQGRYEISDLGSTNGTYVNNKKISARVVITNGDVIGFGPLTEFVFKVSVCVQIGQTQISSTQLCASYSFS